MGWVDFVLSIGLRVPNTPELVETVKSCLPEGKDPKLFLTPLDPVLEGTEWGEYRDERDEPLDEDTYESCCKGRGFALLWYNGLQLECSNGFSLDTNRCYSGGHLEYLRGDYDDQLTISDEQKAKLQQIAEKLGVPFKLSFSLRARGSRFYSIRFDE